MRPKPAPTPPPLKSLPPLLMRTWMWTLAWVALVLEHCCDVLSGWRFGESSAAVWDSRFPLHIWLWTWGFALLSLGARLLKSPEWGVFLKNWLACIFSGFLPHNGINRNPLFLEGTSGFWQNLQRNDENWRGVYKTHRDPDPTPARNNPLSL